MRLLPVGTDHVGGGVVANQSFAERCRHRCRARREYLPMWYLRPHPQSRASGGRASARGEVIVSGRGSDSSRGVDFGRRVFLQRTALVGGGLVLALALPPS